MITITISKYQRRDTVCGYPKNVQIEIRRIVETLLLIEIKCLLLLFKFLRFIDLYIISTLLVIVNLNRLRFNEQGDQYRSTS